MICSPARVTPAQLTAVGPPSTGPPGPAEREQPSMELLVKRFTCSSKEGHDVAIAKDRSERGR
jgi:hypothetical protein